MDTDNAPDPEWVAPLRDALNTAARQLLMAHCESSDAVAQLMAAMSQLDSTNTQGTLSELLTPCQAFDRISQRLVGTEQLIAGIVMLINNPALREDKHAWDALEYRLPANRNAGQVPLEIEMF